MGLLDDMKDKAQDAMGDKEKQEAIKKMAEDKGISIEAAKEHFSKKSE